MNKFDLEPKEITQIISDIKYTINILKPKVVLLSSKDIMNAVSFEPTKINQKIFNTYVDEVTEIVNYIKKKTDINNPQQAQNYFNNEFENLFKEAKIFNKYKINDYTKICNKVLNFDAENDFIVKYAHGSFKDNYIKQIQSIKNNFSIKTDLRSIQIKDFVFKIDILRSALLHSVSRIKKVIEDINPPQQTKKQEQNKEQSKTKKIITEQIRTMDKNGWEYAFKSEIDYKTFVDLLTNFFELKEYKLPKKTIQLKRGCKTRLAMILGEIHSKLSNIDVFSNDTKYFKIVKSLSHFKDYSNDKLYKALTRHGRD